MNILDDILIHKAKEVEERKSLFPEKLLEQSAYFDSPVVSMCRYIRNPERSGIIAEIKRASPSEGEINKHVDVEQLSIGYMQAGASALSVLTDERFFSGSNQDLTTARKFNYCPILRKDFIIDEYQIVEARSVGADCILLIAAALTPKRCKALIQFAHKLDLEVLLEVHDRKELLGFRDLEPNLIGVNNRNLNTFQTDIRTSLELIADIPEHVVRVSESGIHTSEDIVRLKEAGYNGFLIGSHFMKHSQPEKACKKMIANLKTELQCA